MSAPEERAAQRVPATVRIGACTLDILELSARRGHADALNAAARAIGLPLPAPGRFERVAGHGVLCVRPDRWLVLLAPGAPGRAAAGWGARLGGHASVVDLSAAFAALRLGGAAHRELLARGCRLDLDPAEFPAGHAAATLIAQVGVTVVALDPELLLLTPASTRQHFVEWLDATGAPFGIEHESPVPFSSICGDPSS